VLANGSQFLGEHQERRLKGILDVLHVAQDPPADAINHRAVTMHDGLECRSVALVQRSFHELPVRLLTQPLGIHSAGQANQNAVEICCRHAHSPSPEPSCLPDSSACGRPKVVIFFVRAGRGKGDVRHFGHFS
jgi:hypothetical protein